MLDPKDIKTLAKEIVKELRFDVVYLREQDIARMCGYTSNGASIRRLLADPKFPKPVSLIDCGRNRWLKDDVINYLRGKAGTDVSTADLLELGCIAGRRV